MDIEMVETLQLILDRYEGRTSGSVFVPLKDFAWFKERNDQLTRLQSAGLITQPRYFDNGAEITLTQNGRHFFDRQGGRVSLDKEKVYEILSSLNTKMEVPEGKFGLEYKLCMKAIKQLQEQGYIDGVRFIEAGWDPYPRTMWIEDGYLTAQGLQFLEDYQRSGINLPREFISACEKIAANPVSYNGFDEDGLNRELRNLLESAISRFGYHIADQTQQGLGETSKKPGELDIRISKNGIPVAIYEGLIHRGQEYLYDHINKAIGKYNGSGCKTVFVVEYSKNKGFGGFWDRTTEALEQFSNICVSEENTGLLGVRMLKGTFTWEDRLGEFYYIGVNCYYKELSETPKAN